MQRSILDLSAEPTVTTVPGQASAATAERIECSLEPSFAHWLAELPGCLAITTYQAGKLAWLSWRNSQPTLLMRQFTKPMGLAVGPNKLALATQHEITLFANASLLAPHLLPHDPGRYDTLFVPRASYYTGDVNVHDLAFAKDGLWFVNTRFSCLSALSKDFSFVPRWKPAFISDLAPEDRCHLNGLALVHGQPKYVTCLGETNSVGGWREKKACGGALIDIETNQVVLRHLSMPHSPRWHDGRLWLLNSGAGELLTLDPSTGLVDVVCSLPAYLRGLCFIGHYAVVGLCQIREKHIFGGLPVQQTYAHLISGIAVIDLTTGSRVGTFHFTSGCTEIYDIQYLHHCHSPNILQAGSEAARQAFTAPSFSYWLRPENLLSEDDSVEAQH